MNLKWKWKPAHHCLLVEMVHGAASAGKSLLIWEGSQILVEAREEINAVDTPNLGLLCGYWSNPRMDRLEHY